MEESFNLVRAEYADRSIARGLEAGTITPDDEDLIREFVSELQATAGIGVPRINKPFFTWLDGGGLSGRTGATRSRTCTRRSRA